MKNFRTNFTFKVITVYLALNMIFPLVGIQTGMYQAFALTGGPAQPEFNSFTPIGTSDMVDLASGDFNYNIPIMDVGGYPLNLSYNSGITMDQEASWVGLGWNLNVGQINRNVRGLPDDFDGDVMTYENHMKNNVTVGIGAVINAQIAGLEGVNIKGGASAGMTVQYNNYEGISFKPSLGLSVDLSDNVSVGVNLSSSTGEGVTVSPNASISAKSSKTDKKALKLSSGIGVSYNTRQGLTNFNMSSSISKAFNNPAKDDKGNLTDSKLFKGGASGSGSISFVNNTMTPTKRFPINNASFNFDISAGLDFWSIDAELGLNAYGNVQYVKGDGKYEEKAYGYENTEHATKYDILDFNRENDRALNKNSLVLPTTNYTYDYYSIQGQGIGGMYRPFRSQVQYVYDRYVEDGGDGGSLGIEIEGASGFHVGGSFTWTSSKSHTGVWDTSALSYFKEKTTGLNLDYENVYFKTIGEFSVDKEQSLLNTDLGGRNPIALKILGSGKGKYAGNIFRERVALPNDTAEDSSDMYGDLPEISGKIARTERELRNLAIQKITKKEAEFDNMITPNDYAKPHHTAGYKILKNDGATYVYGETAYNITKEETTFAVSGSGDCSTGLVSYTSTENSRGNGSGKDHYFNNIITPAYAHTYLLTSVLSSDYEDINNNGPDDNDLGSYTKFTYDYPNDDPDENIYIWRVPFAENKASYNAGLYTLKKDDQKGSYVYGKKELKYIQKIETKTHIAIFEFDDRNDALGVSGENGGISTASRMKNIKTIKLYSKPEYNANPSSATPIKTAHFKYNYELCKNIVNNSVSGGGKLTLKQVYFTYANSEMGKFTPYNFHYDGYTKDDGTVIDNNYEYNLKAYDIWGSYKPNEGGCGYNDETTTAEFPFVDQNNDKETQNAYASAWSLTSIDLPSGGKIELSYESDEYQFVQDRKAMQMFKVAGVVIDGDDFEDFGETLYTPTPFGPDAKYIVIEIDDDIIVDGDATLTNNNFQEKYIGKHIDKPIFFRFLLNMTSDDYDYVEGYFKIQKNMNFEIFEKDGKNYAAIPMEFSKLEGGVNGSKNVNPISKAGWYFGRNQMNRTVYGLDASPDDPDSEDIEAIARALGGSSILSMLDEILHGPNELLRDRHLCARTFKPQKSWIRLLAPNDKIGGGVRIKKLQMLDNWDEMTVNENGDSNSGDDLYKQFYGQQYSYKLEDGSTSGVASFEPNASKENPFVEPYYNSNERLVAPREVSYVEKPFGISFFPSPQVTYSRVEVKNLERVNGNSYVGTNATGYVVNEFYTTFDFPTKASFTGIDKPENWYAQPDRANLFANMLKGLIGAKIVTDVELTFSQGFLVETNDMNGKNKSQQVYNENNDFISSVDYIYSANKSTKSLDNELPVIDELGNISRKEIGTHYDVINDFRESYSNVKTTGGSANLAVFTIGIIPIILPVGVPSRADHTNTLHTVVTTKVIHNTGILKEKIATDLGAKVSTKNLAWDAVTGQVLVTETKNEYDDAYYSINYPAHWKYKQMGLATNNLDFEGTFSYPSNTHFTLSNANNFFIEGDEVVLKYLNIDNEEDIEKFWVAEVANNYVILMDRFGKLLNATGDLESTFKLTDTADSSKKITFKVMRSGYRNLQSASMASITLMKDPVFSVPETEADPKGTLKARLENYSAVDKIVNASAIEYTDLWSPQCECLGIPSFAFQFEDSNYNGEIEPNEVTNNNPDDFATVGFNPYLYNVKGNFKAVKSYAYLTNRTTSTDNSSPRNDGFFSEFIPFYDVEHNWNILINYQDKWTFASQVSAYSPYGVELENKDALNRYSSAQYGFNYTLPTAVSSNSKYTEMGYDGFEDYNSNPDCTTPHFSYKQALTNEAGNTEIINTESHTGHKSIKVKSMTNATLEKRIVNACD